MLAETYLGRGRPLGETRLLWEIGTDGAEVRALRRRLGIDTRYAAGCCARSRPRGWWRWHPTAAIGGCGEPT